MSLRDKARDQSCIRCGAQDGTVVLAHYFGPRRHDYGGGMSRKGSDLIAAHLCGNCHSYMDRESRNKESRWLLSEEFLHLCALTLLRLERMGAIKF